MDHSPTYRRVVSTAWTALPTSSIREPSAVNPAEFQLWSPGVDRPSQIESNKGQSPELVNSLRKIKLNPADKRRANELALPARHGTLSPVEEAEIGEYRRVGRVIESLKLRARIALNPAK